MSSAADELPIRLTKINSFEVAFSQKVTDGSGSAVQEGAGTVTVKRPGRYRWHTPQPDESLLVCDGETLWPAQRRL
ncbi:outer membrane lipoprotein chaperone LolA [Streptomyces hesseae]|uniref:Outer-membrane lipoprotein carrier protein n=1 Tax=Streptomyces hesseae TaxID=3075519 RepID=A0ABU2SHX4_9ACTN|nr:outer membrane lipoprotein chaperone LolA [Streptomyces sp. DSM 40473]MDT0448577.1 outer membrane lipoprotein chaperone LolA [Streptomyces sp. DSM 40473]